MKLKDVPEKEFEALTLASRELITKVVTDVCNTFGPECATGSIIREILDIKGYEMKSIDDAILSAAYAVRAVHRWKDAHQG